MQRQAARREHLDWSAKIEYDYLDLGTKNYTFAGSLSGPGVATFPVAFSTDIAQRMHLIKVGVNYRFDWGVASY